MFKKALIILSLLLLPVAAYSGAGIGMASGRARVRTYGDDESDHALKVCAEYHLHRHGALEIAYHDLGRTDIGRFTTNDGYFDTSIFSASAKGIWSLHRFQISGKVGYAFRHQDGEASGCGGHREFSEDGDDITYGVALGISVCPGLLMQAEWEGFEIGEEGDARVLTLGLLCRL